MAHTFESGEEAHAFPLIPVTYNCTSCNAPNIGYVISPERAGPKNLMCRPCGVIRLHIRPPIRQ